MAYPRFLWNLLIFDNFATLDRNDEIYLDVDGNSDTVELTGSSTGIAYRFQGDGSADDLAQELEDALNSHSTLGGGTFTVTLNSDGTLNINFDLNVQIDIYWASGNTTANYEWFGRDNATETFQGSGSGSNGTWQVGGAWYPEQSPLDDRVFPILQADHFQTHGAEGETAVLSEWRTMMFIFDWINPIRALQDHANETDYATDYHPLGATGEDDPNIAFETMFNHLWGNEDTDYTETGVYYYPDNGAVSTEEGPYYLWDTQPDLRGWCQGVDESGPFYRIVGKIKADG